MNSIELKQYLQYVLETEKNCYALSSIANRMNGYIQKLGKSRSISQAKKKRVGVGGLVVTFLFIFIGATVVGIIIGAILEILGGGRMDFWV